MTAEQRSALLAGASSGTAAASSASGTYFTATNPTPGTGIAFAVTTGYSATAGAFMCFKNNSTAAQNKIVVLDYIKLITTVVPASANSASFAFVLDTPSSNRWTSGGTAITPVNPNGNDSSASLVQLYAGALTTAAAGLSARIVARGNLRGVIPTVYDEYVIDFGGSMGGSVASAAASGRIVVNAPPIVISPQSFGLLHLWFPSNATTPGTFEFETGWAEVAG